MGEITAKEAVERLRAGNEAYLSAERGSGDISPAIRLKTCREGQFPYAVVIACSDSRVIPEAIFSAGIGDIFVIRVAGNVIDDHQLGSIEYATGHLGTKLVMVLGHDHCGAVGAAIGHAPEGFVKSITDEIKAAIGAETDDYKAGCLNVKRSVQVIKEKLGLESDDAPVQVIGGIYRIESGKVEFM